MTTHQILCEAFADPVYGDDSVYITLVINGQRVERICTAWFDADGIEMVWYREFQRDPAWYVKRSYDSFEVILK